MKTAFPPHRRAFAALVPTLMVLAPPAFAQVQTTTTAPPPVAVAPPPVVPTQTAPAQAEPAPVMGTSAPVVQQDIPAQSAPAAAPAPTVHRAAPARSALAAKAPVQRAAPIRETTHSTSSTSTKTAAAPATQAPAPAPVAETPAAQAPAVPAPAPAAQTQPAPATDTAATTTSETQTTAQSAAIWPWVAAGIVALLAIFGLVALSRRRKPIEQAAYEPVVEPEYVEPVAATPVVEPAPVAEPVAAVAPIVTEQPKFLRPEAAAADVVPSDEDALATAPESAELVAADAADVDALTAGDPPVADRPWLEMAMRPVRAGTSAEDALVEIELTVGNAGSVAADKVRISTFMFAGEPDSAEMERMMIAREGDTVDPVTIQPGEGTMLEATLALSREALDGEISPVIVADARYPLPGGGEGHTQAAFRIGIHQEDGSITPIQIGKPHMTSTVDAELYGTPERV